MIEFDPASFKDPAGRVFYDGGQVYRTLTPTAAAHLRAAQDCGLIAALTSAGHLVEGDIVPASAIRELASGPGDMVLHQRRIPFVSYPYEWSFEMLRDAALTTLAIIERAIESGFILKDATSLNILFDGTTPRLIDTPSLEPYVDGHVWAGYGQFCRCFVFPLLLHAHHEIDLQALLRGWFVEVPVREAVKYFGMTEYMKPGVLKDVVLQARLDASFGKATTAVRRETAKTSYPKALLRANVQRLRSLIVKLRPPARQSEWSGYDAECNYSPADRAGKQAFVTGMLSARSFGRVVDLGCNTGTYSLLALAQGTHVLAIDLDTRAIDALYRQRPKSDRLSPVVANLLNPTPAMGWRLRERRSLLERVRSDAFLALALVHHLRITGNVPLDEIVDQLFSLASEGVVEWVDKTDSQVASMLALRPDVYDDYTVERFESLVKARADVIAVQATHEGRRRLYHVRERAASARPTTQLG